MKPIVTVKHRTLEIAVFENQFQDKTFRTVAITKSYKDKKTDKWEKQSISIAEDQILTLASMLEQTFWAMNKTQPTTKENTDDTESTEPETKVIQNVDIAEIDDIPF